jgi:hypothetical protein
MDLHPNELPIPPKASEDRRAVEILRVWAAGGKQHVTLATGLWKDPACWGLMLVDLAKHVANAYAQSIDISALEALRSIRKGIDAEWESATDAPTGQLIKDDD